MAFCLHAKAIYAAIMRVTHEISAGNSRYGYSHTRTFQSYVKSYQGLKQMGKNIIWVSRIVDI